MVHRLLSSFLLGAEPSKELLSLVKGGVFTLLRAIAQDELSRRASYTLRAMAPNVRGLCDLISGLEGLQRLGCSFDFKKGNRYLLPAHATSSQPVDGTKSILAPTVLEAGVVKRPITSSRRRIADLQCYDSALNDTQIAASIPHCDPVSNTIPPQVIQTQSYSIEANLRPCASSVRDALRSASLKKAPPSSSSSSSSSASSISNRRSECDDRSYRHAPFRGDRDPTDPSPKGHAPQGFQHTPPHSVEDDDLVVIEVAIALASLCNDDDDDELPEFETVYCGSSFHFRQVGLTPSCTYLLRCRAASKGLVLGWSPSVEFTTDPGISFTFDPQKCGTDIQLGEGNLKASYAGDDNWSTLLGSRSFSTGKVGWEIRITHTSTAYLFVGVATSEADLNTYLGGCSHGWGFIGEQALYHSRENVKGYGEAFSTGDFIGISLDFHRGTLSFSRNGKSLGVAFDKICGELYPAVAFYNTGQELEIIPEGFRASCPQEATECSPSRLNLHGTSHIILTAC